MPSWLKQRLSCWAGRLRANRFGLEHGTEHKFGNAAFVFKTITDRHPSGHGFRRAEIVSGPGDLEEFQVRNPRPGISGNPAADHRVRLAGHRDEFVGLILGGVPDQDRPVIIQFLPEQVFVLDRYAALDQSSRHNKRSFAIFIFYFSRYPTSIRRNQF